MSDQNIEITRQNRAYYYVEYCQQNNIRINESKIGNHIERMQQPLMAEKLEEEFKNIIFSILVYLGLYFAVYSGYIGQIIAPCFIGNYTNNLK